MPDRFYSQKSLEIGQVVLLDPQQSHHLLHVLRAEVGDEVHLFDGGPDEFLARIDSKDRRSIRVNVLARIERPISNSDRILVAAPVPKGDRFRFLIEKLTELGVSAYLPIVTTRSVNPLTSSLRQKMDQWVIEACKQCARNQLMEIFEAITLPKFLTEHTEIPDRYVACTPADLERVTAPGAMKSITNPESSLPNSVGLPLETRFSRALLVGPEGGFTVEELGQIQCYRWTPQSLGQNVLRIETAAIAGAVVLLSPPFTPVRQS